MGGNTSVKIERKTPYTETGILEILVFKKQIPENYIPFLHRSKASISKQRLEQCLLFIIYIYVIKVYKNPT